MLRASNLNSSASEFELLTLKSGSKNLTNKLTVLKVSDKKLDD